MMDRYPYEFSGGQRQRIGIARAHRRKPDLSSFATNPFPPSMFPSRPRSSTSYGSLQERFDLTYLFIAHDLSVVRHISDRVAVMYLGKIVEITGQG